MNDKDIFRFVQAIKKDNSFDEAYFSVLYNEDHDGYTGRVETNKQGLQLFSTELLIASLEIDERSFDEIEVFDFLNDWKNSYSELDLTHIQLSQKLKSNILPEKREFKETFKDKVIKFLFLGLLIFILISIIVGAYTILSSFF